MPQDEYHRRTMYTYFKRNAPPPSLMVFDMADRNVSTVARKVSSTPLQALVLLNDPQYLEAYRKMAERVMRLTPDPQKQVVTLFRLATRRHPLDSELAILSEYRESQFAHMASTPDDVKKLLSIGVAPADKTLDQPRGRGAHDGGGRGDELARRLHTAIDTETSHDHAKPIVRLRKPSPRSRAVRSCREASAWGSSRRAACWAARHSARPPQAAHSSTRACSNSGHFPARARRVISIQMCGAVSQVDSFDYKPQLIKMHGTGDSALGEEQGRAHLRDEQRAERISAGSAHLRPFRQYGQSGRVGERPVPLRGTHRR